MTIFAIERDGSLVNQLVFNGNVNQNLYRTHDIRPMTFMTLKAANEVADAISAVVVDYDLYIAQQRDAA